jgi:hypothetical protein
MAKIAKTTGSRIARWYAHILEQKKARGSWYTVENYGVH